MTLVKVTIHSAGNGLCALSGKDTDSSSHKAKTGSLYITSSPAVGVYEVLVPVDTWFTQEVIIRGNHIVILVNDRKTVDFIDKKNTYVRGHLALEVYDPPTVVQFRRIEVKELK